MPGPSLLAPWSVAVLLLALAPGAATAGAGEGSPISGGIDATGPVTFAGAFHGNATWAALLHDGRQQAGAATAAFHAEQGRFVLYREPAVGGLDALALRGSSDSEKAFTGDVTVAVPPDPDALASFRPYGALATWDPTVAFATGQGYPATATDPFEVAGRIRMEPPAPVHNEPRFKSPPPVAAGGRLTPDGPGDLALTAPFSAMLFGPTVTLADGTVFHTGLQTTPAGVQERVYLLIDLPNPTTLALRQEAAGGWFAVLHAFDGAFAGDLAVAGVKGTDLGEGVYDEPHGLVQLVGDGHVSFGYAEDKTHHWNVDGTGYVRLDGKPVGPALPLEARIATSVGVAAALVLLGKLASLLLAGRSRAEPLEHPTRRRLLDLIGQSPGISSVQLRQALGIQRPALTFHLGLLEKAGHVQEFRHGRRRHYALPADAAPTRGLPVPTRSLLASCNHPLRSGILQPLLATRDALGIKDLAAAFPGAAPGRTLLDYHLRAMHREGILVRSNRGRRLLWSIHPQVRPTLEALRGEALRVQVARWPALAATPPAIEPGVTQ